jgi:hypothetical protein
VVLVAQIVLEMGDKSDEELMREFHKRCFSVGTLDNCKWIEIEL